MPDAASDCAKSKSLSKRLRCAFQGLLRRLGRFASLLLGLSAIGLVWIGSVYSIHREYEDAEAAAISNGANLTRAFEEQLIRSLRAVDQTILYVRDSYARDPQHFDISLWSRNSQFLSDFSFQVAIIDKDGFLAASNIDPNAARVDLSDREHFKVHKNGSGDELFISKPVLGRVSNKWSVQITRRIIMPDGAFGGVVVVSLDPSYLSRFYESIDIGKLGTVTVVGTDGIIRARSARAENASAIGQSLARSQLFEKISQSRDGNYENNAVTDGVLRIFSYRQVEGYPLIVTVGQGHDEILGSFYVNRRNALIGATLITLWIVGVMALIQRYQNGLARARDAAEAGTRARSEFLAMMSHEIRTPMNGVIGITDLLMDSGLSEQQEKMAHTLRESAEHLLQIINDVLDFTKLDAEKIDLEYIEFDVEETVANAVNLFLSPASAKGVAIRADISADVPARVAGDPARVRQVLFNLIGNAVKFTASGAITVRVTRGRPTRDGRIQLDFAVIDTGIGIPEESLKDLFQQFTQVDSSIARRFGGTGLGLAICKRLVERMGGEIGVSSTVGKGSTFRFSILVDDVPATVVAAPALVLGQAASQGAAQAAGDSVQPEKKLRILLAEDNLTNQMVATKIIERLGHDVTVVSSGAQALSRVQSGVFDVVLMDVMMPEIDGLTATRTIRKLPSIVRDIPIIALTANAMRKDDEMCRAAGMNGFVAKPVTRERLRDALRPYTSPGAAPVAARAAEGKETAEADIFVPEKFAELRSEIGPDGAAEVMATFIEDTAERVATLRLAMGQGAADIVANEAHALKSSSATFGFMRLSQLARILEHEAKAGNLADGHARVARIAVAYQDVRALAAQQKLAA